MGKISRRKQERQVARKRDRVATKLIARGARFISSGEQLSRDQNRMLARFAKHDISEESWKPLIRCRAGQCVHSPCSAACWFGDRGKTNELMLNAGRILRKTGKRLHFVTIIDPHYAVPAGELATVSIGGMMASLRRRFRLAGGILKDDPAFGTVEAALEVMPDGHRMWFVHLHLVLASDATAAQVRIALRPARAMPTSENWGRTRWKPVVVKRVTNLTNLLAYITKRTPEENNVNDKCGKRTRLPSRLREEHRVEHDLWLLPQRPSDRIFKRCMKEVHGKLVPFRPPT